MMMNIHSNTYKIDIIIIVDGDNGDDVYCPYEKQQQRQKYSNENFPMFMKFIIIASIWRLMFISTTISGKWFFFVSFVLCGCLKTFFSVALFFLVHLIEQSTDRLFQIGVWFDLNLNNRKLLNKCTAVVNHWSIVIHFPLIIMIIININT